MKLKKKDLIKALRPGFEAMGYHYFKDSISGASGLFGKKVDEDLYLQAALNIARFYDDEFTVDLCISTTTFLFIGSGADVPKESERRPGELLTTEERLTFFHSDCVDYWWSLHSEEDIRPAFFDVLLIAEHRIVNNKEVNEKIRESVRLKQQVFLEKWVIEIFEKKQFANNLLFTPDTLKDEIPLDWFRASETLLLTLFEKATKAWVYSIASRAFIRFVLDSLYEV